MEEENGSEDLDTLFERYSVSGTPQQKAELAESYLDLFSQLCYDFACGKLTEDGIEWLPDLVEKMEVLQEKKLWSSRAQVYEILMEAAEEKQEGIAVIKNGLLAIEALTKQLEESALLRQSYYERISYCHAALITFLPEQAVHHWENALYFSKASIAENQVEANWAHHLQLLYVPSNNETAPHTEIRQEEIHSFRAACLGLEVQSALGFVLASAFARFKERMEPLGSTAFEFPEVEYLFWLEKSLSEAPEDATSSLSAMGHFYRKEGVRLQRTDLLEKALSCFELLFYRDSEPFAIYYTTDVMEQLAALSPMPEEADEWISKALVWNEHKQELIKNNFSLLLHYSEFLERCYHYNGNIQHPSLSHILFVAKQAEGLGEGYYSGPYFLQARMALEQKNERAALAFLCRALLLHELCIEESVVTFYKYLPKETFPYLEKFTAATLLFMKEVSEGYYFNPVVKFKELDEWSDDAVIEAWILRKAEIKRREKLM